MRNNFNFIPTVFLIFVMLLSACGTSNRTEENEVKLYISALEAIMETDTALNHNAKFISIDFDNLPNVSEQIRQEITTFFEKKYTIDTIIASLSELKDKGMFNEETLSFDGVLLKIEKVDVISKNEVRFVSSKYKSGLGAFECKMIVQLENDKWNVKELITTRES